MATLFSSSVGSPLPSAQFDLGSTAGTIPSAFKSPYPTSAWGATPTQQNNAQFQFGAIPAPPTLPTQPAAIAPPPSVVVPTISTPVAAVPAPIQAATVAIPGGTYEGLQSSFYNSAFAPVDRQLSIQQARDEQGLQGQLAAAGLADSGAGVGAQQRVAADYAERRMSASQQAADQAAQARYQAEIAVSSQNAAYAQQAGIQNAQNALQLNLANAGFSLDAQKANAANVLAGNIADAQAYLQTAGINAQQATAWRDDFIKLYGIQGNLALQSNAQNLELFNLYLQNRKILFDMQNAQVQNSLEQEKISLQKQLGLGQLAVAQQGANTESAKVLGALSAPSNSPFGGYSPYGANTPAINYASGGGYSTTPGTLSPAQRLLTGSNTLGSVGGRLGTFGV